MYFIPCVGGFVVVIIVALVWFFFLRPPRKLYPPLPPPPLAPFPPSPVILDQKPQPTPKKEVEIKFDLCTNCGKKIPMEDNICPYCETKDPFKPYNLPNGNNKL